MTYLQEARRLSGEENHVIENEWNKLKYKLMYDEMERLVESGDSKNAFAVIMKLLKYSPRDNTLHKYLHKVLLDDGDISKDSASETLNEIEIELNTIEKLLASLETKFLVE